MIQECVRLPALSGSVWHADVAAYGGTDLAVVIDGVLLSQGEITMDFIRITCQSRLGPMLAMAAVLAFGAASAAESEMTPAMQAQIAKMGAEDRQMILSFTPELRQRFFALSPELRVTLGKLHASHPRHSKLLTLRQVMQEILSEYQGVAAAIATDNAEQAADGARQRSPVLPRPAGCLAAAVAGSEAMT